MGGSPKRGGPNGGAGVLLSRGRVILVSVLVLQLVLVVCLMKAPRLIWSSTEERVEDLGGDVPPEQTSQGSWLWRKLIISTTKPNCTDADGRVVTEAAKGASIKCSDRSSLLRVKRTERGPGTAKGPALRPVNSTTRFRNTHGANNAAGFRTRGGATAIVRNGPGEFRQGRVQVGRGDLPVATGDFSAMANERKERDARETKRGSWRLRTDFDTNIRSSLERDALRSRHRTVGYGDQRPVGVHPVRDVQDESVSIAKGIASNASAAIAPGATNRQNVSGSIAPAGVNVSESIAPVVANVSAAIVANATDSVAPGSRIRASALDFLDNEQPDEEESEEDEFEPLPSLNASSGNTPTLEFSPENSMTLTEMLVRNTSLPETSMRNSTLADISSRNASSAETSTRNFTFADEVSLRNATSPETSTRNSTLADEALSFRNASSAETPTRNSTLAAEISSKNASTPETSTRNSTLADEVSGSNTSFSNQTSQSPTPTATRAEEFEQAASPQTSAPSAAPNASATCPQGLVYVYKLPKKFNTELLENCSQLLAWGDRCRELSNGGLGPSLSSSPLPGNASAGPWHSTDQFNGEVIFHNRILAHPCRTRNPELATAFFIPYYGGLDVARFLFNITDKKFTAADRDNLGLALVAWLGRSPYWKRRQGVDHFLFLGRITWDFRRQGSHGWGSGLLQKAEMANVTKLTLERSPYDDSETAVPYPTAFHPRNDSEMVDWQNALRGVKRDLLFSFAGGKREKFRNDFRVALFDQCAKAVSCEMMNCSQRTCVDDALATTKLFVRSTFCLQPRGDSFTRRSIFDALVAGCIPVFFWTKSAYLQYSWHLPADHRSYSVFIPKQHIQEGGVQIEQVLSSIPAATVRQMQERVLDLIPRLVYSPHGLASFRDAVDTTIDHVMAKVELGLHPNASRGATTEAAAAPAPLNPKPLPLVAEARA